MNAHSRSVSITSLPYLLSLRATTISANPDGHEFIGKWVNTESPSDSVMIAQDGSKFVIADGIHALVATYDHGALASNSGKGKCSYPTVNLHDGLRRSYKRAP